MVKLKILYNKLIDDKMGNNKSFLGEIFSFLKERKAWWLVPVVVLLLLVGVLIIFSQSSVLSPFIYALF